MSKFFSSVLSSRKMHDQTPTHSDDGVQHTSETMDKQKVELAAAHGELEEEGQTPNESAQQGVRNVEAVTLTWSKKSLAAVYICMWLIYFVRGFQSSMDTNLGPYITSGFESHSLIPVIYVVSSSMSAATLMPLTKIINVFDRSIGFIIMLVFAVIGLILSATSSNVETYAAAQVFYGIGFVGMIFSVDVITADTSTMRDRGLAYAFTSSPYIIIAFAGPKASESLYDFNWRWGYGSFAIILPVVALPLFFLIRLARRKAKRTGMLPKNVSSGRTLWQNIVYYIIEFDLLGAFLLAAGLVLFLLPFTIAQEALDGWSSSHIIAMLVLGAVLLLVFPFHERYLARVPFVPWNILISRTVLGACLLAATYQIAYYCWNDYFPSFLQVVFNVDLATAGYISSIFDVVSGVWLLVVGLLIKKTARFRWLLYIAVPLYILGIGLMIYFRRPNFSVGYTIMCQIFIAFAGGTMIIVQQVAVLAATDHNNLAATLAILNIFSSIGGAIGSAISGAIWTNTLPDALQRLLPDSVADQWEDIYDSLDVQLSYSWGSEERNAIIEAYAQAQQNMLIAGTAIMALALVWVFVIRDLRLDRTQTKGTLF